MLFLTLLFLFCFLFCSSEILKSPILNEKKIEYLLSTYYYIDYLNEFSQLVKLPLLLFLLL